jgi:putative sterol carrier protein
MMIEDIFKGLPDLFVAGAVDRKVSFYFTLEGVKKTVTIDSDGCSVEDGKTVDNADCVCKTSQDFFLRIWNEGYRPGLKDFLTGSIKSNDPDKLRIFLKGFGKDEK